MRYLALIVPSLLLAFAFSCASSTGSDGPELPASAARLPEPTALERALLQLDGGVEKVADRDLRAAFSTVTAIPDRFPPRRKDKPILILREIPELRRGDLLFAGVISVGRIASLAPFPWSSAVAHLKTRARELGADLVIMADAKRDPTGGLGWNSVEAAAFRYRPAR